MIVYRDLKHGERLTPPAWLEGAGDLHVREDAGGRLFGIGDGRMVGPAPDKAWVDVGDGIQARMLKPFIPEFLRRQPLWCRSFPIADQQGNVWSVPQILATDGSTLAIQVHYGPGWEPELTPLQQQAEKAARWARQTLTTAIETDMQVVVADACQATAEILSAVLYISPQTLAALRLLDQFFMLAVLRTAAGWIPSDD